MEQGGLNISDVDLSQSQDFNSMMSPMPQRGGGGVSAPKMPESPMVGAQNTKL